MVGGAKLREESLHRRVEAERIAAAQRREADLKAQLGSARRAAYQSATLSLAKEEFQFKKDKAMTTNTQNIDFIDPKDFKMPSVVSERDGRTYYTDGSYSVKTGEYDEYLTIFMPNGVIRVSDNGELTREELPNGAIREYKKTKLKYEKDSEGNYKLYDPLYGRIVEEGTKDGWIKYPTKYDQISSSGDYRKYNYTEFGDKHYLEEEGNINGKYTRYDKEHNVIETGDYQTKKYQKFNKDHRLVEEGYLEKKTSSWFNHAEWLYEYDKQGNVVEEKERVKEGYFERRIEQLEALQVLLQADHKQTQEQETMKSIKVLKKCAEKWPEYEGWVTYKPYTDGSGFYLSKVGTYTFDELGRTIIGDGKTYTYHGDTDVVATMYNEIMLTSYDEKGRIIEEKDDFGELVYCTKYTYYGDTDVVATKNEDGVVTTYDKLGNIIKEEADGKLRYEKLPDGTYHRYHNNGQTEIASFPDGTYFEYNEKGEITYHETKGFPDTAKYLAIKKVAERQAEKSEKMRKQAEARGEKPKRIAVKKLNPIQKAIAIKKAKKELSK